jgi:hypothetical protein
MENSGNGDTKGDIVARGIVSEERARVMYERYVQSWRKKNENWLEEEQIITCYLQIYGWKQKLSTTI